MTRLLLAAFVTPLLTACVTTTSTRSGQSAAAGATEAFVIGSLHDQMLKNPKYTLRDFTAAIEAFRPDLILTEVRQDHPGAIEGSIDGGIEQSLVYAYGTLTNIPVTPVDWYDEAHLRAVAAEKKRLSADSKKQVANQERMYAKIVRDGSFALAHSPKTQSLLRKIDETQTASGLTAEQKRTAKICENIKLQAMLSKGKRIAVVFGLDQKYAIEDCLRSAGVTLVSAETIVKSDTFKKFQFPGPLKEQTVNNLNASQRFLSQALSSDQVIPGLKPRLEKKLARFPAWTQAVIAQ